MAWKESWKKEEKLWYVDKINASQAFEEKALSQISSQAPQYQKQSGDFTRGTWRIGVRYCKRGRQITGMLNDFHTTGNKSKRN